MAHAQEPSVDVISASLTGPGRSVELKHYRPSPTHHPREEGSEEAADETRVSSLTSAVVDQAAREAAAAEPALIVELDGVLLKSNAVVEAFFSLLGADPRRALAALPTLRHGSAAFKARIAGDTTPDLARLPWNE